MNRNYFWFKKRLSYPQSDMHFRSLYNFVISVAVLRIPDNNKYIGIDSIDNTGNNICVLNIVPTLILSSRIKKNGIMLSPITAR